MPAGPNVHMIDCGEYHCGTVGDWGLFSSVTYPRSSLAAGVKPAVHSEGAAPLAPVLVVGTSLGNISSTCPVGSGALKSREELTRLGSTSRTRVRHITKFGTKTKKAKQKTMFQQARHLLVRTWPD